MKMESSILLGRAAEPEPSAAIKLLNVRGSVADDGAAAFFQVAMKDQAPFSVSIPFSTMPAIFAEVRQAQAMMIWRQQLQLDRGNERLLELCSVALRPAHVDYFVDPFTGECIFVNQFDDHAPVALRLKPEDLAQNVSHMMNLLRRQHN